MNRQKVIKKLEKVSESFSIIRFENNQVTVFISSLSPCENKNLAKEFKKYDIIISSENSKVKIKLKNRMRRLEIGTNGTDISFV